MGATPLGDPNGLTINGDSANDVVDLDYTVGNPLPPVLHLNGTFYDRAVAGGDATGEHAGGSGAEHGLFWIPYEFGSGGGGSGGGGGGV